MRVWSGAYAEGTEIPARFANSGVPGGRNVSVPLVWNGEPDQTRSFAIATIDHHPVAHGCVHWLVVDIPPSVHQLAEGVSGTGGMPSQAVELPTSYNQPGYGGPNPPAGSGEHDYVTTVFALDTERLAVGPSARWDVAKDAMQGHVLASATVMGRFGR
jgi:Raf kinase inhibitor-like YbhB/YbcL family protein